MTANRTFAILVLAALLSACASYNTIWLFGGYYGDAQTSGFRFSGADRDFRTAVVGNPFNVPRAETERAVIAAIKGEDKGLRTNFTTTPRTHYKNNHIVMLFNPSGYYADKGVCRLPSNHSGKGSGGSLVLAALYCEGDRLVYGVAASARNPIKSPQDPQFARFVKELMDFFVPRYSMIGDSKNEGEDD